jgi:hypothetical protein
MSVRFAAGIRAGSDGTQTKRDYGLPGAIFGLGLPVLFGGLVYAATEPPPLGHTWRACCCWSSCPPL